MRCFLGYFRCETVAAREVDPSTVKHYKNNGELLVQHIKNKWVCHELRDPRTSSPLLHQQTECNVQTEWTNQVDCYRGQYRRQCISLEHVSVCL